MKIGFFTDSYLPQLDGVASSVSTCVKELESRGHEVYVIAPQFPGQAKEKNVIRILSIKIHEKPNVRVGLQIPQRSLIHVLRLDFDIIHGHSGGPITLLGWQIAQLKNVPYIGTYHTMWNRYAHYFLRGIIRPRMLEISSALFGNLCDVLIAPTEKVKEELVSWGVRKPIHTIPSGINIQRFKNHKKGYLHSKLKIESDKKILLSVGRLNKEKSMDFLIKAFVPVYKKNQDALLVLVGDGDYRSELEKLAEKQGVKERVFFTGPIPNAEMPQVYADADIFLFASQTETQGMVVIEAMASSLPIVVVKDKAFDQVVINDFNGYIAKKSYKDFSEKLLSILSNDQKYKKFSENSRKHAEHYSVQRTVDELEKLYQSLVISHSEQLGWKDIIRSLNEDFVRLIKPGTYRFTRTRLNITELDKIKNTIKKYLIG